MTYRLKKILSTILLCFAFNIYAQNSAENLNNSNLKYKINSVNYDINGNTKSKVIEKKLTIDFERIFSTKEDFEKYLSDLKQELLNKRLFDKVNFVYVENKIEENISYNDITFIIVDSKSMLALPKPNYSSNEGFELKIKMKDENFLGFMNTLGVDVNLKLGNKDAPDDFSKVTAGFNFSYDFPFYIGNTINSWNNKLDFDWEIGNSKPNFSYDTGITVGIPFGRNQINLTATQSIKQDSEYAKFGDELYFAESTSLSIPLVLGYIGNTTAVKYTPSVSFNYNWDTNGINESNTDLSQTPTLKIAQKISLNKVNWTNINNFRKGFYIDINQTIGWDYSAKSVSEKVVASIDANAKYFHSWNFMGFSINSEFFAGLNTNKKIGSSIRGALDYQKYSSIYSPIDSNNYALETPVALCLNIDFPIHIITTDWMNWGYSLFGSYEEKSKFVKTIAWLPHKLFKYLDFELQLSPFLDIGLIKNRANQRMLNFKEGIYTTGVEMLLWPSKWKSYVVRISFGYDISNKFMNGNLGFDSSYRNPNKNYEFFFGLGTHF